MVETINKLKFLTDVVSNDLVRQQFINVYNAVWKQGGEQVYEREANYFNKILRENANLNGCTSLSVFFAFIDLAVQGISVEPGVRAMAYLLPRNYKIGTDQQGKSVYEKRCNLTISGYGELYLRARLARSTMPTTRLLCMRATISSMASVTDASMSTILCTYLAQVATSSPASSKSHAQMAPSTTR